jgi:hypothetical protein
MNPQNLPCVKSQIHVHVTSRSRCKLSRVKVMDRLHMGRFRWHGRPRRHRLYSSCRR